LVGEKRMILCRLADLKKVNQRNLIRKAFPELFTGMFRGVFKKINWSIEFCSKMVSSQFSCQVDRLEKDHNWNEMSFIALKVIKLYGKPYCDAEPVSY
jgi:hypothetical protein